jgi:hypothetical protein
MSGEESIQARTVLVDLREVARGWVGRCLQDAPSDGTQAPDVIDMARRWNGGVGYTQAYADLTFAFGLARVGARDAAGTLIEEARAVLQGRDEAHSFLFDAYAYRIGQALAGQPHRGPLSADLQRRLCDLVAARRANRDVGGIGADYVIDCQRTVSRILEPDQRISPYRHAVPSMNAVYRAAADLEDITDAGELTIAIRRLLAEPMTHTQQHACCPEVFSACLEQSARADAALARELLRQCPGVYDSCPDLGEWDAFSILARLLERGLHLAVFLGQRELLPAILNRVTRLVRCTAAADCPEALGSLLGECLAASKWAHLREEFRGVLELLPAKVSEGRASAREAVLRGLRLQLAAARGWLYLGEEGRALPLLEVARRSLYQPSSLPVPRAGRQGPETVMLPGVACAYARAHGELSLARAKERFDELFNRLPPPLDTFTTLEYYRRHSLEIIESVVWALADRTEPLPAAAETRRQCPPGNGEPS